MIATLLSSNELFLHSKDHTEPNDDAVLLASIIVGIAYSMVAVTGAIVIYRKVKERCFSFRKDGCLMILLPFLSLVGGLLWPLLFTFAIIRGYLAGVDSC